MLKLVNLAIAILFSFWVIGQMTGYFHVISWGQVVFNMFVATINFIGASAGVAEKDA